MLQSSARRSVALFCRSSQSLAATKPSRWLTNPKYGLYAHLFTANAKSAPRGARAIRTRTVMVNSYSEGDISHPVGGYKQSGFGGRDNGEHTHDHYTQLKIIRIDLSDDAGEAVE